MNALKAFFVQNEQKFKETLKILYASKFLSNPDPIRLGTDEPWLSENMFNLMQQTFFIYFRTIFHLEMK